MRARAVMAADPEVLNIATTIVSRDGAEVLIRAIPRHDGESPQGQEAVKRLRANLPAGALVGGTAAYLADYHAEVIGSMWKVALFVMAVTFFVLMLLLRSIVLPLKAVIMNLLSVSAAYGVLTLVFGTVETLIPPLVLAVVFGLSMDYEVFLLSRIRERYAATGDTRRAVVEGLSASAPTITSAALIMVCVFSVFALTGVPSIKELGLGCALAIAIDATIVRLVLVPTAMELFGKWNWWLPGGLARYLPDTSVEALGQHAVAAVRQTNERRPVATDMRLSRLRISLAATPSFTTRFTSLPGTTISLTISRPSMCVSTLGAARHSALSSSAVASLEACTRSRSLPLTWHTSSYSSRSSIAGSACGHGCSHTRWPVSMS